MTHLNIQQGLNIEVVSTNLIKKLYEAALSVPEPLEGELDAAYMSGNLLVNKSYRALVEYLTNRFDDLHINVTDSYYIPFEDSAVLSALLANNIGDGVGITESNALAVTNMSLLGLTGNSNITSFTELRKFKNITTGSTDYFAGCTNLEWIALPENNNNIGISYLISGGKTLKWVVPSVEFVCSKNFGSWYNNPGRGGGADHVWTPYDLNKQPITDVVIPDGVTTIGKYVFSKMSCDSITIPTSITDIKQRAFENTLIVSPVVLNLPNLTSIEQGAFLNCTAITSITNLGSITSIPSNCFLNCTSLSSVVLPNTYCELGAKCFLNTNISSIDTSHVTYFGELLFSNTNISTIDMSSAEEALLLIINNKTNLVITLPNEYVRCTQGFPFGGCELSRITNPSAVENWSKVSFFIPGTNPNTEDFVLNFSNATSCVEDLGSGGGMGTYYSNSYKVNAVYSPKITDVSTRFNTTYNRLHPLFGKDPQSYLLVDKRLKIKLLYFKDLNQLSINAFGGLVCQAMVINNITPPTVISLHYDVINEYYHTVRDVYCDSWGNLSLINGTSSYSGDANRGYYENNNKLFTYHDINAIYVPDSAVATYQNASGWSSVSSLIQPISSLNSGVIYANETDWITAGKPTGLIADHLGLSTADLATFVSANNLTYYTAPSN